MWGGQPPKHCYLYMLRCAFLSLILSGHVLILWTYIRYHLLSFPHSNCINFNMKDQKLKEKSTFLVLILCYFHTYWMIFLVFLEIFISSTFYDAKFQMTWMFLSEKNRIGILPLNLLAMWSWSSYLFPLTFSLVNSRVEILEFWGLNYIRNMNHLMGCVMH